MTSSISPAAPLQPTSRQRSRAAETYAGGVWDVFLTQVNLNPVLQITSVDRVTNGHFVVNGQAGALLAINIQASPDLIGSFTNIGSTTTDFSGAFQFEDADANSLSQRFYRTTYP